MNTPTFTRRALFLSAALLSTTTFASPLADRLERPSRLTAKAQFAPLIDVQRVGDQLVMVGAEGHILLRKADGQVEQTRVPVDLLLTAVHFVDDRQGWAVGHDGVVLHSDDGGVTWTRQLDGRVINALMLEWAQGEVERLQAAASVDEQALESARFALDDIGAGAEAGPSRPLLDVWFRNAREGWVVGAYGTLLHTADGGSTWAYVAGLDNPDRLHLNSVMGLDNGDLLVAGEGGRLYRQSAGLWQPTQVLTPASLYKLTQLHDGQVLAMGFGGALLRSRDHGQHWQAITLPSATSLYGAEQLADDSLLLSGQAGLLHSRDLQHFRVLQPRNKAVWLGAATLPDGTLALVGSRGLRLLGREEIKEYLQ
ncbi:BNR/Asp-box repeat protein [Pseudomonas sp. GM78]|uniref:YCF48-related protein n=1 Tax=Pseudomonas sp. GM78 TaxID=1144337 RepID=UPI0002707AA2|nr:YCF48-related protein [Pseudomonas sp. GM78]EJN23395.1 BNR/Asp-box repeat protein [Pseudomonas sp. GM78]